MSAHKGMIAEITEAFPALGAPCRGDSPPWERAATWLLVPENAANSLHVCALTGRKDAKLGTVRGHVHPWCATTSRGYWCGPDPVVVVREALRAEVPRIYAALQEAEATATRARAILAAVGG